MPTTLNDAVARALPEIFPLYERWQDRLPTVTQFAAGAPPTFLDPERFAQYERLHRQLHAIIAPMQDLEEYPGHLEEVLHGAGIGRLQLQRILEEPAPEED
jgi:hypothetical protein